MDLKEDVKQLRDILENLRSNHFAHLSKDVSEVKTDVAWLKQFFWIIAGASIGGLATGVMNLILK